MHIHARSEDIALLMEYSLMILGRVLAYPTGVEEFPVEPPQ
jgi:hypothetical protein